MQEILNILEIDIGKIIDQSKYKIIQAKNIIYPGLINNWEEIKINNHMIPKCPGNSHSDVENSYINMKCELIIDIKIHKKVSLFVFVPKHATNPNLNALEAANSGTATIDNASD